MINHTISSKRLLFKVEFSSIFSVTNIFWLRSRSPNSSVVSETFSAVISLTSREYDVTARAWLTFALVLSFLKGFLMEIEDVILLIGGGSEGTGDVILTWLTETTEVLSGLTTGGSRWPPSNGVTSNVGFRKFRSRDSSPCDNSLSNDVALLCDVVLPRDTMFSARAGVGLRGVFSIEQLVIKNHFGVTTFTASLHLVWVELHCNIGLIFYTIRKREHTITKKLEAMIIINYQPKHILYTIINTQ